MIAQTLPLDLGGYQHLEPEVVVLVDDILVSDGKPVDFCQEWHGETVAEVEAGELCRVYRKYPCPRQGGDRPLTQDERDAQETAAHNAVARAQEAQVQEIVKQTLAPKAATYDDGKPPLACLPLKALREVALVQLYGHKKYGDFFNYRKGMEVSRNASCAMRHIADYMDGQDLDAESQRNHLAHAACRLLFMLENLAEGTAIDDRYGKRK